MFLLEGWTNWPGMHVLDIFASSIMYNYNDLRPKVITHLNLEIALMIR